MTGLVIFGTTVAIAVCGYILAGWTPLDAVYMVVITIFGVGYSEVQPLDSPTLKVFTILVIIAGVLSVTYIVSGVVQSVAAGEIRQALNLKRMTQNIANLESHVIICGYGRIGQMIAHRLRHDQLAFVILDSSAERIADGEAHGFLMYMGSATDEESLEALGIQRARAIAIVLPDDAANVFITLTARELNPSLTILARGEMPSTEKKLRLAGADHVVLPATIGAARMAHLLTHPYAVDFLSQSDGRVTLNELLAEIDIQMREIPIAADSPLAGATIGDIEVSGRGTFIIVALQRETGETLIHPSQDTPLSAGDTVMIMGHQDDIPRPLKRRTHGQRSDIRYRGARLRP